MVLVEKKITFTLPHIFLSNNEENEIKYKTKNSFLKTRTKLLKKSLKVINSFLWATSIYHALYIGLVRYLYIELVSLLLSSEIYRKQTT